MYGQNREMELILMDHNYSKPSQLITTVGNNTARPMNSYLIPRQSFWCNDNQEQTRSALLSDNNVSVVDYIPVRVNSTSRLTETQRLMSECETHVAMARGCQHTDECDLSQHEMSWLLSQKRLITKVLKALTADRLARLTISGSPDELVLRRIQADKTAKRFRQALATVNWDCKLSSWLHVTLVDQLSNDLLATYLDVLRTLKAKIPSLIDKMLSMASTSVKNPAFTSEALAPLLIKPWDPHIINPNDPKPKLSGNPLLLICPNAPTLPSQRESPRAKFWQAQLSSLGKVIPVTLHTPTGGIGVNVKQCLEHMIGAVKTKLTELKVHFADRPVVLLGWGVGALLACHVALNEPVHAIVCLGFPLYGVDGCCGEIDDPLLKLKIPTMFVIGQNSNMCSVDDVEYFREKLKADNSLMVIGGADDNLRLSKSKKQQERVTQSMVDRCIQDEIAGFLHRVLSSNSLSSGGCVDPANISAEIARQRRRYNLSKQQTGLDSMKRSNSPSTSGRTSTPRKETSVSRPSTPLSSSASSKPGRQSPLTASGRTTSTTTGSYPITTTPTTTSASFSTSFSQQYAAWITKQNIRPKTDSVKGTESIGSKRRNVSDGDSAIATKRQLNLSQSAPMSSLACALQHNPTLLKQLNPNQLADLLKVSGASKSPLLQKHTTNTATVPSFTTTTFTVPQGSKFMRSASGPSSTQRSGTTGAVVKSNQVSITVSGSCQSVGTSGHISQARHGSGVMTSGVKQPVSVSLQPLSSVSSVSPVGKTSPLTTLSPHGQQSPSLSVVRSSNSRSSTKSDIGPHIYNVKPCVYPAPAKVIVPPSLSMPPVVRTISSTASPKPIACVHNVPPSIPRVLQTIARTVEPPPTVIHTVSSHHQILSNQGHHITLPSSLIPQQFVGGTVTGNPAGVTWITTLDSLQPIVRTLTTIPPQGVIIAAPAPTSSVPGRVTNISLGSPVITVDRRASVIDAVLQFDVDVPVMSTTSTAPPPSPIQPPVPAEPDIISIGDSDSDTPADNNQAAVVGSGVPSKSSLSHNPLETLASAAEQMEAAKQTLAQPSENVSVAVTEVSNQLTGIVEPLTEHTQPEKPMEAVQVTEPVVPGPDHMVTEPVVPGPDHMVTEPVVPGPDPMVTERVVPRLVVTEPMVPGPDHMVTEPVVPGPSVTGLEVTESSVIDPMVTVRADSMITEPIVNGPPVREQVVPGPAITDPAPSTGDADTPGTMADVTARGDTDTVSQGGLTRCESDAVKMDDRSLTRPTSSSRSNSESDDNEIVIVVSDSSSSVYQLPSESTSTASESSENTTTAAVGRGALRKRNATVARKTVASNRTRRNSARVNYKEFC